MDTLSRQGKDVGSERDWEDRRNKRKTRDKDRKRTATDKYGYLTKDEIPMASQEDALLTSQLGGGKALEVTRTTSTELLAEREQDGQPDLEIERGRLARDAVGRLRDKGDRARRANDVTRDGSQFVDPDNIFSEFMRNGRDDNMFSYFREPEYKANIGGGQHSGIVRSEPLSRSRAWSKSLVYDDPRAVDPELGTVQYVTDPAYTQPGTYYDPAAVDAAAERSRERGLSRSRSRARDIDSTALAAGVAALGLNAYRKRKQRREAERKRREAEGERRCKDPSL